MPEKEPAYLEYHLTSTTSEVVRGFSAQPYRTRFWIPGCLRGSDTHEDDTSDMEIQQLSRRELQSYLSHKSRVGKGHQDKGAVSNTPPDRDTEFSLAPPLFGKSKK